MNELLLGNVPWSHQCDDILRSFVDRVKCADHQPIIGVELLANLLCLSDRGICIEV